MATEEQKKKSLQKRLNPNLSQNSTGRRSKKDAQAQYLLDLRDYFCPDYRIQSLSEQTTG